MTRRPLSPMPTFRNISEEGHQARLFGQWQRLTNQADIVIDISERPQVDIQRELGQLATVKVALGENTNLRSRN